jgi:prepilin-type N-terminal cleavage/methylation domain-containing protein
MKTDSRFRQTPGFTLVEIMIVVAIIGLLVVIAVPNYIHSGNTTRLNAIYSNLRVLEGAKENWAIDNHQVNGANPALSEIRPYFLHDVHPVYNETYVPNPIGTPAEAQLPPGSRLPPYAPGATIQAK